MTRIRENLEYDTFFAEDEEHDWRQIAWHPNKSHLVNVRESSPDIDLSLPEGEETHFLLRITMRENCTP